MTPELIEAIGSEIIWVVGCVTLILVVALLAFKAASKELDKDSE